MGYSSLVYKQLLNAFKLVGDLGKSCTISKQSGEHFDFATGQITGASLQPIVTTIIQLSKKMPTPDRATITATILIKAVDVGNLDLYDTFTYDGYVWNLISPIKGDGHAWILLVSREG